MANVSSSTMANHHLHVSIDTDDYGVGKGLMTNRVKKTAKLDPIDPQISASLANAPLHLRNSKNYDLDCSPDSPSKNKIDAHMSNSILDLS